MKSARKEAFSGIHSGIARRCSPDRANILQPQDSSLWMVDLLMTTDHASLRQHWGIVAAAVEKWSISLARGEVPGVDADNQTRKFESMDDFFAYLSLRLKAAPKNGRHKGGGAR